MVQGSHKSETTLKRAFREVAVHLEAGASELAQILGVQLPTVREKFRRLERLGLVRLEDRHNKAVLNPEAGYVVGIDLGASNVRFALADFCGKLLDHSAEPIRPEDGPAKLIVQIKQGIRTIAQAEPARDELPASVRAPLGPLRGLAVGVPSPVDPTSNLVSFANNLPGWKNIDLARELADEFGVPVALENDANMAAIGEHWRGVAREAETFVFIALGTGIGTGVFVDGSLHRGRAGNAGELYRLNIEWPRWNEDFGEAGYFESQVSGLGIAALGREALATEARSGAKQQSLVQSRDARFVFEAFHQGDQRARAVLERVFTMLGVAAAAIVTILDPDLIVFGGGLSKGAPQLLLETAERVVRRIIPDNTPPIKLSALENNAQTYGAIVSALTVARQSIVRDLR